MKRFLPTLSRYILAAILLPRFRSCLNVISKNKYFIDVRALIRDIWQIRVFVRCLFAGKLYPRKDGGIALDSAVNERLLALIRIKPNSSIHNHFLYERRRRYIVRSIYNEILISRTAHRAVTRPITLCNVRNKYRELSLYVYRIKFHTLLNR